MTPEVEILRQNELFQTVMREIKKERPTIPPYNYEPDNTEEWKSMSNQQRGFDLALSLFGEHND